MTGVQTCALPITRARARRRHAARAQDRRRGLALQLVCGALLRPHAPVSRHRKLKARRSPQLPVRDLDECERHRTSVAPFFSKCTFGLSSARLVTTTTTSSAIVPHRATRQTAAWPSIVQQSSSGSRVPRRLLRCFPRFPRSHPSDSDGSARAGDGPRRAASLRSSGLRPQAPRTTEGHRR